MGAMASTSRRPKSRPHGPLLHLSTELLLEIIIRLPPADFTNCSVTCTRMRRLFWDHYRWIWRHTIHVQYSAIAASYSEDAYHWRYGMDRCMSTVIRPLGSPFRPCGTRNRLFPVIALHPHLYRSAPCCYLYLLELASRHGILMSITTFLKTKLLMHDAETDEIFVNLIHLSAFLDPEPVLRSDHSIELFEAQMRFLRMLTMAQRQSLHRFVGRLSSALVKFHVTVDGEFWDRLWPRGLLIKRWDLEPRWMYHSPGFLPWLVADQLLRQISLRNLFEFIMALGDDSRAPLSPSNHGCVRPYPLGPYGVIELWTSKAQMDPLAYLAMSAQRGNRRPWYRTWIGGADPWEDVRIGWLFRGRGDDVDGADAQPDFDFTTMMPVEMP